ncbi:hypothetical protein AMTRI_Chr05g59380 [Amborella trichopoda]
MKKKPGKEVVSTEEKESKSEMYTRDASVDWYRRPAIKAKTGGWKAGSLLLVNQGLATLAFYGVEVNLVLFLTRVLKQGNAEAANNVSKWTGTVNIFSLIGAFLSDSYWGRYKTCVVFQLIFVFGLLMLSIISNSFLLQPFGCGHGGSPCKNPTTIERGVFYVSIYLIALGNGGYQTTIPTFGADQFDGKDSKEAHSKVAFFSYFDLALNLGSLFSITILAYFEDEGKWTLGFWMSSGSALIALLLFPSGIPWYRHFAPSGNPLSRFSQVVVASLKKWRCESPSHHTQLFEVDGKESAISGCRKIVHTPDFKFLDKAAIMTENNFTKDRPFHDPWLLCTVTQVEEVKCILRLLPIWLCTIIYYVVFTQMASLFVEQAAAMKTDISGFHIPPASMSTFDILSATAFIIFYRKLFIPCLHRVRKNPTGLTELQRMGLGLITAIVAMISAGFIELIRLRYVKEVDKPSSLSILLQIPQYVLIGASEVFMYIAQLEFFNAQAPDGLKSFGNALCMTSMSLGNYFSSFLVGIVMGITRKDHKAGWIAENLNQGHMDKFYFLLAALTAIDFVIYVICAKGYRSISYETRDEDQEEIEMQMLV